MPRDGAQKPVGNGGFPPDGGNRTGQVGGFPPSAHPVGAASAAKPATRCMAPAGPVIAAKAAPTSLARFQSSRKAMRNAAPPNSESPRLNSAS
ncbi:hypothetical protein E3U47_12925 [Pseudomonas sp. RIT623]|nr:hypothetical protein E3U47_12925 [Pseudomonas sp. RIT623]